MGKRILVLLMSVMMIVTYMPAAVFAVDDVTDEETPAAEQVEGTSETEEEAVTEEPVKAEESAKEAVPKGAVDSEEITGVAYAPHAECIIEENTSGHTATYELDGEDVEYWAYSYNYGFPQYGDQLSVYYEDYSWLYEFQYVEEGDFFGDFFVNTMDPEDRIGADDYVIEESKEPWEPGEHSFTFRYAGFECEIPVTIVKNEDPVVVNELSFSFFKPINLVEGVNMTTMYSSVYDEETGEWLEDKEYEGYSYPYPLGNDGNVLTVDGTDYVCGYSEEKGEWGFTSADGDWIPSNEVSYYDDQSYDNQWTPDNPGHITISYGGQAFVIDVEIHENPVESISYRTVKDPVLVEGTETERYTHEILDEETGEVEEIEYKLYDIWPLTGYGSVLTVNNKDYVFGWDEDHDDNGYTSADGDWIPDEDVDINSDQSYDNRWSLDNPGHITVSYMGRSYVLDVEIVENPVESISFRYGEDPYLIEGVDTYDEYEEIYDPETDTYEYKEYQCYRYPFPGSSTGDILTVNGIDYVAGWSDEHDDWGLTSADGDWIPDSDIRVDDDQSYDNQWSMDTPGHVTITYMGRSCEIELEIHENPVKSISFECVEPIELIEGVDGDMDYYTDSEGNDRSYFRYWPSIWKLGNRLIVNDTDVYTYKEVDDEYYFVNEDGEMLGEETLSQSDNQSPENPWTVGNTYYLTVKYMAATCEVPVTIIESPVESISFQRADGSTEMNLIENIGGMWRTDRQGNRWYDYDPQFEVGDKLTVNETDGDTVTYVYKEYTFEGEDEYWFINENDPEDVLEEYSPRFDYENNQDGYEERWLKDKPEGAEYIFTIRYLGKECNVPVNIIENPVKEISFSRDGYDEEHPIELMDGKDGWINSDGSLEEYFFEYRIQYEPGDVLKVTTEDEDGNTEDTNYIAKYNKYGLAFENEEDPSDLIRPQDEWDNRWEKESGEILTQSSDQTFANQWEAGTDHSIQLGYMNRLTDDIHVKTVQNPIESISYYRPGQAEDGTVDLVRYSDGFFDEDGDFWYNFMYKAGDKLLVKYVGIDEPVEYVATSAGGSYIASFIASDVPSSDISSVIDADEVESDRLYGWGDDDDYLFRVSYGGRSTEIPARIVDSPIEGISFERPSADGEAIELLEGIDGWFYDDSSWFRYEISFREGDILKVEYPSVDEPVAYTYETEEIPEGDGSFWIVGKFVAADEDLPEGAPSVIYEDNIEQDSDQSQRNTWAPDEDHVITLRYLGKTTDVNIKTSANKDLSTYSIELTSEVLLHERWRVIIAEGTSIENPTFEVRCREMVLPEEVYDVTVREILGYDFEKDEAIYSDPVTGPLTAGKTYYVTIDVKDEYADQYTGTPDPYEFDVYGDKDVSAYHTEFVFADGENEGQRIDWHVDDIESTPYEDWFYFTKAGTPVRPRLFAGDSETELDASNYKARYNEVYFNEDANEWQQIDESEEAWSDTFPTKAGVYLCEIDGVSPYYGTVTWIDLIKVEGEAGPAILSQPKDLTVTAGETATFKVTATGTDLKYQWQWKSGSKPWANTSLSGYNTDTLSFTAAEAHNGRQYRCVITDADGTTLESNGATLTVKAGIKITEQPEDVSVAAGETAIFKVTATGSGLKYQWQWKSGSREWSNTTLSGYNTDTLSFTAAKAHNGRQYRCVVTDASGNVVESEGASLTVTESFAITAQPEDITVAPGEKATFSIAATGDGLKYQWQWKSGSRDWANTTLSGYNTNTLSFTAAAAHNGRQYRCVVTDASGNKLESDGAKLTVAESLAITAQPEDITVAPGEKATFKVTATGTDLKYQWQWKSGSRAWANTTLSGYNTDTLSFTAAEAHNGRQYRCVVTDAAGNTAESEGATLTVAEGLTITEQPEDVTVAAGSKATFKVTVTGVGLKYQWQWKSGSKAWANTTLSGYNTDTLSFTAAEAHNGRQYRCVITDASGNTVESNGAKLTVTEEMKLVEDPEDVTVKAGEKATFKVTVTGVGLKYQWQWKSGSRAWANTTLSGYNTDTLSFTAAAAHNGRQYRCVITDATGTTLESEGAVLTVE